MTNKIKSTPESWEEGLLGEDEQHAEKANVDEKALDEALELQMISVRLQKSLIDDLKNLAQLEDLGYQPLMRRVLQRYVDGEKEMIANQYIAATIKARKETEVEAELKAEKLQNKKIA